MSEPKSPKSPKSPRRAATAHTHHAPPPSPPRHQHHVTRSMSDLLPLTEGKQSGKKVSFGYGSSSFYEAGSRGSGIIDKREMDRLIGRPPPLSISPASDASDLLSPANRNLQDAANLIYEKYIKPGADSDVNVPRAMHMEIKAKLDAGQIDHTLFDSAQKAVGTTIYSSVLPNFPGVDEKHARTAPDIHLTKILSDDDRRAQFVAFCERTHCEEFINFFLAVEKFRPLRQNKARRDSPPPVAAGPDAASSGLPPGASEQLFAARALYEQYLKPGAMREISAPPNVKKAVKDKMAENKIELDLFDEAQKHVLSIMRVDILPQFLDMLPNSQIGATRKGGDSAPADQWTLENIFQDKEITKAFLKFCKSIYSEENALFFLAVEKYKIVCLTGASPSQRQVAPSRKARADAAHKAYLERAVAALRKPGQRRRSSLLFGVQHYPASADEQPKQNAKVEKAQHIFDRFVQSGGLYELNLPPQLRNEISTKLKAGSVDTGLFDKAQKHAFNVLFVDIYPKFLDANPKSKGFLGAISLKRYDTENRLKEILDDRSKYRQFLKFAKRSLCHEYVLFYRDVEKFRTNSDSGSGNGSDSEGSSSGEENEDNYANNGANQVDPWDMLDPPEEEPEDPAEAQLDHISAVARELTFNWNSTTLFDEEELGLKDDSASPEDAVKAMYFLQTSHSTANAVPKSPTPKGGKPGARDDSSIEGRGTHVPPPQSAKPRVKSILKVLDPNVRALEERMRVARALHERQNAAYVARLKAGEVLTKYNSKRKPVQRRFAVSEDGTELMWGDTDAKKFSKRCDLADVIAMYYGPFSNRFKYFDCSVGKSWLCFVIEFEERTFDIVCEDEAQLTAWFIGIQNLAPLNPTYLTYGGVLWTRANMKVDREAYFSRKTPRAIWAKRLLQARAAVKAQRAAASASS